MKIVALDPGTRETGIVVYHPYEDVKIPYAEKLPNSDVLKICRTLHDKYPNAVLAIEKIVTFNVKAGAHVFESVWWSGRFLEAAEMSGVQTVLVERQFIKKIVTGNGNSKDSDVRQAVIKIIGPDGTKKNPGPTFKLKGATDKWAAAAVAITAERLMPKSMTEHANGETGCLQPTH